MVDVATSLKAKKLSPQHGLQLEWNEQQVSRLRELFAKDLSASDICCDLGCSRNAVIGKIHRLGLSRPFQPSSRPRQRKGKGGEPNSSRVARMVARKAAASLVRTDTLPPHVAGRKQLFDLTSRDCRYPFGTPGKPDFYFCGEDAGICGQYCPEHSQLCGVKYAGRA